MEKGLLSILVPVFQVEHYLRDCVDSLLRQSIPCEIWLVDDGSTDNSGAICDDYAMTDERIHVIHKENGGSSSARLAGIQAANGEYLAFVDSDDWVDDDMFECLLRPLLQDPQLDSSMGGYVTETVDGAQQAIPFIPQASILSAREAGHRMFTSQGFNWSLCGKVYRSSLFQDAEFLQRWPRNYGEDTFINYHLLQRMQKVAYVPIQGYHYRIRQTSMTHQPYHSGWMDYFRIYDEILADASGWNVELMEDIRKVAGDFCISRRMLLLEDGSCLQDAETMRKYLQKWFPTREALSTPALRWQWDYAAMISPEAYQARKRRWGEELRQFARNASELYLYGTGIYGIAFAKWLDELHIRWHGAIESVPREKQFHGKPILSPDQIAGQDAAVLLAMNERHTREVMPVLVKAGITKVLEGWKMMFGGRS